MMKKLFLVLFCAALSVANCAELGIFPEKMVYPMAGFAKWQCGRDAITTEQTRGYSWTSRIKVDIDAAQYRYFNVRLSADRAIKNGSVTVYFLPSGAKRFGKGNFCRQRLSFVKGKTYKVSIPLKNPQWKGRISGLRLDLGGAKGTLWKIEKIWLSDGDKKSAETGDFTIFPGKTLIKPQVGFKTFTLKNGIIEAEHSRGYAYTAAIPAGIEAEKFSLFNMQLESPTAVDGKFSVYFMKEGEKRFTGGRYVRGKISLQPGKAAIVSLPLKHASWKGKIARIRFDFSVKPGQKWLIRRIWFSNKQPMAFKNPLFMGKIANGSAVEVRHDLLTDRVYSLSWQSSENATGKCEISFYSAKGEALGKCASADGKSEITFSLPDSATVTRIKVSADGAGELSGFHLREVGKKPGNAWSSNWLCHPRFRSTKGLSFFAYRREFELPVVPSEARLQITADDGQYIYVNGKFVGGRDGGWQATALYEITPLLKVGKNVIEVSVRNENGPTGLIAELRCDMPDGKVMIIPSDRNYKVVQIQGKTVAGTDYSKAVPAMERGIPPVSPWHCVAFYKLMRRKRMQLLENSLQYSSGMIFGKFATADFGSKAMNLHIVSEDIVLGKFPVSAVVRDGKFIADVKLDIAKMRLFPGKYTLMVDPDYFSGEGKLLTFTIPPRPVEKVPHYKMVNKNGYLQLMCDGKPVWMGSFKSRRGSMMHSAYWEGDFRLLFAGASKGGSDGSNSGLFWVGPDRYDFTKVEKNLENALRKYPDAIFLVTVGIDAPKWWADAHPDECVRYYGRTTPEGLTSPASAKWRRDSLKAIRELIRHLEKSPYASRIVGYRLQAHSSGGEFQYLGTWSRRFADYSPAMEHYFREFLRKRYKSDAALKKAWNNPAVTLATATIPSKKERQAADYFVFLNLDKSRNVADFTDCMSDAMVTAAIEHLKVVRSEAPKKLAGLYGGYVFYYGGYQLANSGHSEFGKLYRSRLADFICSPQDYFQRLVGWPGGHHGPSVGTQLYNISYLDENDTRTILCAPGGHRHVNSLHETIGVLKRDHILQLTKGLGNIFYDLAGGWFAHDAIIDAMKTMNKIGTFAQQVKGFKRGQAAVLYSAESIRRLSLSNLPVVDYVRRDMRRNLGWGGITSDQYLLEDLHQKNFPEYDCYILPNVYAPTDALRKLIATKLDKPGKLLIFGYAPGAFRENSGKIDLKAMKELTGMKFGVKMAHETRRIKLNNGRLLGVGSKFAPAFYIDDPNAKVLARFTASGRVAAAMGKTANGATVVVTMLPEMDDEWFRSIFKQHGMHLFCDSGDPVYFDGRFIAIHARSDGKKVLRLPEAREWFDLYRGKKYSNAAKTIEIDMARGQTEVFFVGDEAEFQRYLAL